MAFAGFTTQTEQWLEQFPFWSESTLKRAFASLKALGLLRSEKLNKSKA